MAEGRRRKRLAGVFSDMLENFPTYWAAPSFEHAGSDHAKVVERLAPVALQKELFDLTKDLAINTRYEATIIVGDKSVGTQHPHRFILEREPGALNLFFIDPEHWVGSQNPARPRVTNLMASKLFTNDQQAEIAIARYRTTRVQKKLQATKEQVDRLELQEQDARSLVQRKGIPNLVSDMPEEMKFRVYVDAHVAGVQTPLSTKMGMVGFLKGKRADLFLEGKIDAQQAIIRHFIQLLKEGAFEAKPSDR